MGSVKQSVLVVAVDPRLSASIKEHLQGRGLADVFTAWGVDQGRELLEGIHFDVVVIDIDLPYGRGQQLMVEVAVSHPGTRRVAMGRASRRGLRLLIDGGLVHDAVAKPVDMAELVQAAFTGAGARPVAPRHMPPRTPGRVGTPAQIASARVGRVDDVPRPLGHEESPPADAL